LTSAQRRERSLPALYLPPRYYAPTRKAYRPAPKAMTCRASFPNAGPDERHPPLGNTQHVSEWRFTERNDGIIEVELGSEWPGCTEALNDSVSTGHRAVSPPVLDLLGRPNDDGALATDNAPTKVLASGNAASLALDGVFVVAQSDDEMWPDERMSREDFVRGMESWTADVLARLGRHS
jgi:hypothetical protein